ncbi:MAG: hypothetical protein AAF202_12540, partial [Pseudomonadota bacterium]
GQPYSAYLIGVGAGQEIKAALMYNAQKVVANDLVPEVIDLGRTRYSKYNGGIFLHPNVQTFSGDGRIGLAIQSDTFDVIQIFSNYLSSSLSRGRGFFSPSYLLTEEAFQDYFEHLNSNGVLQVNHHSSDLLLQTAQRAWEKMGRTSFGVHSLRVQRKNRYDFHTTSLIKMSPWETAEINKIRDLFQADPSDTFEFEHPVEYKINYSVTPTDDRPFLSRIYESYRDHPFVALITFSSLGLLFALFMATALARVSTGGSAEGLFFAIIGFAFVNLQLSFDKIFLRFLEYPQYIHILCLCVFPVSLGFGSLLSAKLVHKNSVMMTLVAPFTILFVGVTYGSVFELLQSWHFSHRLLAGGLVISILGLALGPYFPLGMKNSKSMSWNWLLNGLGAAAGAACA